MSSQAYIQNRTPTTLGAFGSGFSVPTMSTTERLALGLGAGDFGMAVYDTTLAQEFTWNGTAWTATGAKTGTWVPTLTDSGGGATYTATVLAAQYVTVGGMVFFTASFDVTNAAGVASGNLRVSLPFAASAVQYQPIGVIGSGLAAGATTALAGSANGAYALLYHYAAGVLNSLAPHVQTGSVVSVSGCYIAA